MFSRSRSVSLLILALAVTLGPVGCAANKPREKWWQFWRPKTVASAKSGAADETLPVPSMADGIDPITGEPIAPGQPIEVAEGTLPEPATVRGPATPADELLTVRFDYDSAELTGEARQALDRNAEWIKAHPGVQILIEGHCDDRGTVEYNLNLGQRRANAVKAYLVQLQISDGLLHTISYGEERPIDASSSEGAWALNRRAQFLVY